MKCLFIGGSHAGKVIEVDIRRNWVAMPGPIATTPASLGSFDGAQITNLAREHEIYKIDFATDKAGNRHTVYVYGDEDPLIQLMHFYAEARHQ